MPTITFTTKKTLVYLKPASGQQTSTIQQIENWKIGKLSIEKLQNWKIEKLKNWKIEKLKN